MSDISKFKGALPLMMDKAKKPDEKTKMPMGGLATLQGASRKPTILSGAKDAI
jgi:hypothetical protein